MSGGAALVLMATLFLTFGYISVPVSFALIAGVLVAVQFTPISMQSMVGQLFHGINSEALLAVPFFLARRRVDGIKSRGAANDSPRANVSRPHARRARASGHAV